MLLFYTISPIIVQLRFFCFFRKVKGSIHQVRFALVVIYSDCLVIGYIVESYSTLDTTTGTDVYGVISHTFEYSVPIVLFWLSV